MNKRNINSKQPFLFIINSIPEGCKLNDYTNDFVKFKPIFKFVKKFPDFKFIGFLAFRESIKKDDLHQILKDKINIDQINEIPPINDQELNNFPLELLICPIPTFLQDIKDFDNFFGSISKFENFHVTDHIDYRIIKSNDKYSAACLYRFLHNLDIFANSLHFIKSDSGNFLPIALVTHIPVNFPKSVLEDTFYFYLKEQIFNSTEESSSTDNPEFYSTRITFKDFETAERAVEKFNFTRIDDHEIYLNLCLVQEEYLKEMKKWKLMIEGIPNDLTSRQLYQTFLRYGKIYKAFVKATSNSPTYGYVQYLDKKVALDVEKRVDQAKLNGNKINVFRKNKIIINNFSSKDEIEDFFSEFNPFKIKIKENEGKRPVVYASFRQEIEATNAIELASNIHSMGMCLQADFINHETYSPSSDDVVFATNSIHLTDLPHDYNQLKLIDLCRVYGMLTHAVIRDGKSNDFVNGIVRFQSQESATNALKNMEGLTLDGNLVTVSPSETKSKD